MAMLETLGIVLASACDNVAASLDVAIGSADRVTDSM